MSISINVHSGVASTASCSEPAFQMHSSLVHSKSVLSRTGPGLVCLVFILVVIFGKAITGGVHSKGCSFKNISFRGSVHSRRVLFQGGERFRGNMVVIW